MIANFADPDRSQAVRWTAIQAIHAIGNLREQQTLDPMEVETLRTLGDDLVDVADWTKWVREESLISGLFTSRERLQEEVLLDASGFTPDEVAHLRTLAAKVESLIGEAAAPDSADLDALEDACSLLITRLESRAEFRDSTFQESEP